MEESDKEYKGLSKAELKKAAKFAGKLYKELESSSKPYHSKAKNKWRKHYDSIPVTTNIDDDNVLSKIFIPETHKACDNLATRLKMLAPGSSDRFDYRYAPGGLENKDKLNLLRSMVLTDLEAMKYDVNYKKSCEDYCVEGTMWHKLEWDSSTSRSMKIESKEVSSYTKEKLKLNSGEVVEAPREIKKKVLTPEFYEESNDRGKMVPCSYDRIFVNVESGEDLCDTDLAQWETTDFATLERLEYDKSTGEGMYHNVSVLKDKIYDGLSEEDKNKKVSVELINVWADYDYDGNRTPTLCRIVISKDHPDICLSVEKDPYKLGHKPFYKTVLFRRKGKQLGIGIPEMVWNEQIQLNDAQTIIYQNAMRRGYGMGFYSNTAGINKRQMKMKVGKMIGVADPNNAYKPIQFEDVSAAMMAVQNQLRGDINAHHGVSNSLGGESPSGVDTAHEFERLLQMSTERIKDFLSNIEENIIEPFLNDYILLVFYNWDSYSSRVFKVIGDESETLQSFVRDNVYGDGFEKIKFRSLGSMKMEHDAVTNKRVFDTYTVFKDDGTVPPSGKWKIKSDVLKSLHPNINDKEVQTYLGPVPTTPPRPFVPPQIEAQNKGGMNPQSIMNTPAGSESDAIKGAMQTQNINTEGTGNG